MTPTVIATRSDRIQRTLDHLRRMPEILSPNVLLNEWSPEQRDAFHADYIKQIVLGVVVAPDQEISYNQFLVQYLSARLAERLIVPAKEFWGRQYRQVLTNGP